MKKLLQDMDVKDKRIVLRCDYNVPIKDGVILDDSKIVASLPTINYLLDRNCSIVILSHLGKVKSEEDKKKNSLEVVAVRLKELINSRVIFAKQTRSISLEEKVALMQPKDVMLIENTRFEDFPEKLESDCNPQLSSYWASLGDIFVMDAFGSSHRKHASTYGISKYIPSCTGFLIQKEVEMLDRYVLNPDLPFSIIMGGAKIDDKLLLIEKLLPKCNYMLFTGGIANTFLKVLNLPIGESLASDDDNILEKVSNMLNQYRNKIVLPVDVVVGRKYDESFVTLKSVNQVADDEFIGDIGTKTIEKYGEIINSSRTIFLNGTAGIYEDKRFTNGTLEMLEVLKKANKNVLVGGGDACSAVRKFKYENDFTYLSTGGGATLEYLVSNKLPALEGIYDDVDVL